MVDAKTTALGLLGHPVGHSFSPLIHNAISESLGLNYLYLAHDVSPDKLGHAVKGLSALGYKGVNVTVPHKANVIEHLTEIRKEAKIIGAVNTILFDNNRLIGYNTDCYGFTKMLEENKVVLKDKRVLILGAGGAARAVVAACILSESQSVTICSRQRERSEKYVKEFDEILSNKIIWEPITYSDIDHVCEQVDIVVNCTPLGMHPYEDKTPIDPSVFRKDCVLVDLIYNPARTEFLKLGAKQAMTTINGLGMLIHQALKAYEIWTGKTESSEFVRQALKTQGIIE